VFPSFENLNGFQNSPLVALSNDKGFRALQGATNATRVGLRSLFEKSDVKTSKEATSKRRRASGMWAREPREL
jgi:hypothetical protein